MIFRRQLIFGERAQQEAIDVLVRHVENLAHARYGEAVASLDVDAPAEIYELLSEVWHSAILSA